MAGYGFPDNPSLATSSRVRAWWLQNVRGWHVVRVSHRMRTDRFGHVRCDATYLMTPHQNN